MKEANASMTDNQPKIVTPFDLFWFTFILLEK